MNCLLCPWSWFGLVDVCLIGTLFWFQPHPCINAVYCLQAGRASLVGRLMGALAVYAGGVGWLDAARVMERCIPGCHLAAVIAPGPDFAGCCCVTPTLTSETERWFGDISLHIELWAEAYLYFRGHWCC